jgi:Bacterial Ig-like domain (group 3)
MRDLVRRAALSVASLLVLGAPVMLATPTVASAATACTRVGNLELVDATGSVSGFMDRKLDSFGTFDPTTTPSDALSVQATDAAAQDLVPLNAIGSPLTNVGGIVSNTAPGNDLGPTNFQYVFFGTTAATAPGAVAAGGNSSWLADTGAGADFESAIWTVGPGGALIPQWVNTDGSVQSPTVIDTGDFVLLTGDTTYYTHAFNVPPSTFRLAPTAPPNIPCASTATLTGSSASAPQGAPVTFTATVASNLGGPPVGTVAFSVDGSTIPGCGAISPNTIPPFTAICTTSGLTAAGSPHSIVAKFAGDTTESPSTSPAISQDITIATTSTAISASPTSPSAFGQPVTLTAKVTGGDGGGTVAFSAAGNAIAGCGTVGLSGPGPYKAICTVSRLPVGGPFFVDATYGGDASSLGSEDAIPYAVGQASTTTSLSAIPVGSSTVGQPVTFTTIVAAVAPGAGAPGGTVSFTADGSPIAGCGAQPLSASSPYTATCTTSALSVAGSPHSIVATYGGDASFAMSASAGLNYTVNKASTTTSVSATPVGSSTFGQPVTFTATVAAVAPGAGTPGGSVAFTADGSPIASCSAQLLSASSPYTATCTTSALSVAGSPHSIVATYGGDGSFAGSHSAGLPHSVIRASTTTRLSPSPASPSTFGQQVRFTATVTGGDGGGAVTFTSDGSPIAGCVGSVLTGPGPYVATCVTSGLTVAGSPHSIVATYGGDASFARSASAGLNYTVNKASTTTRLNATPVGSSTFGQPVTVTATVGVVAPGAGVPGGSVSFTADGSPIPGCSAQPVTGTSTHVATCVTTALSVGGHSFSAAYSGDGNYLASASSSVPYTVNKAATRTTLSASPAGSSAFGSSVTLTAAVAAVPPGAGLPTGSVAFTVDGTAVGSQTLSGSAHASIATSSLAAGAHTIGATYSGDGNFLAGSGSLAYTVTCAVTITGNHPGGLLVSSSTCVGPGASVSGLVYVTGAGALDVEGATLNGAVEASGSSGAIRICASTVNGVLDIRNELALVIVGDPGDAACAPNTISGLASVANNKHGAEVIDNTIHGFLLSSGNSGPGPFPGDPTTIAGNHG